MIEALAVLAWLLCGFLGWLYTVFNDGMGLRWGDLFVVPIAMVAGPWALLLAVLYVN